MTYTTKATLDNSRLILEAGGVEATLHTILDRATKKHGGFITVTIGTPKRPRSTGHRSQNSKVWGMVADLTRQFNEFATTDVEPDHLYEAFKRMAVAEGYPTRFNLIDGIEEPESQSRVSVEQDQILIRVIKRFADENNLYLTEYDEHGNRLKTIGGKAIDE